MAAASSALGLYVHVPFCSVKCFYCDFTAFSGQNGKMARAVVALEGEGALRPGSPKTFYAGGGTPSELPAELIERLFQIVEARYGRLSSMSESSFEANPESLSKEKLEVLKRFGVSRLSLGLQSADDGILTAIGRRHDFAEFLKSFKAARARGFALNVDLMYGLPGQSRASSLESLRRVLELDPGHVSLYGLQVEDRTLFAKRGVEADEDEGRLMFEDALDELANAGYRHYEISNFAKPGFESIHNLNYWVNGSYIGLGCGAAGYLDGERWQNHELLKPYLDAVERGEPPVASAERLSGKEALGEELMLRLRLIEGASLTAEAQEKFRFEIESLLERGLVTLKSDGCSRCMAVLKLTREGIFLANEVFREFVPPFAAARGEVHA